MPYAPRPPNTAASELVASESLLAHQSCSSEHAEAIEHLLEQPF
jgi:hypothetical protein